MFFHGMIKKIYHFLFFLLFCCALIIFLTFPGKAASFTDDYVKLPQSELQALIEKSKFQVTKNKPANHRIECFAALNDQYYAFGKCEGLLSNQCTVSVYNGKDEHLFSATFDYDALIDLAWNNDNLLIRFVRADWVLEITPDGECIALYDAGKWKTEEPGSYFDGKIDLIGFTRRFRQPGYDYIVSSTKIERLYPGGTRNVIYKAPSTHKWLLFILIVLFFVVFFSIALSGTKKIDKEHFPN